MVLINIEILKNQINKKWINKNYLKKVSWLWPRTASLNRKFKGNQKEKAQTIPNYKHF